MHNKNNCFKFKQAARAPGFPVVPDNEERSPVTRLVDLLSRASLLLRNEGPHIVDPLAVVCTHHKCGTVWLRSVFAEFAASSGLCMYDGNQRHLEIGARIFFQDHSRIWTRRLPNCLGVHLIRDPRDIIISGAHYHRHSAEAWLHRRSRRFRGKTYQQAIEQAAPADRLIFEMDNVGGRTISDMMAWNYAQPKFLEVKYEELLQDADLSLFEKIYHHLKLPREGLENFLAGAERNSLFSGALLNSDHIRDGTLRQWARDFTQRDKEHFKALFGDALIRLGYERDNSW